MTKVELESDGGSNSDAIESMTTQLGSYGKQLTKQLQNLDAKIDAYHLTVQKEGNGVTIDFGLRTTIQLKQESREE